VTLSRGLKERARRYLREKVYIPFLDWLLPYPVGMTGGRGEVCGHFALPLYEILPIGQRLAMYRIASKP